MARAVFASSKNDPILNRKDGGVTALVDCVDEQSAKMAGRYPGQALAALVERRELALMLNRYGTVAAIQLREVRVLASPS